MSATGEDGSWTTIGLSLEGCQNVGNLKNWKVTYNGSVPEGFFLTVESYDASGRVLSIRRKFGTVILMY